jgi:DNA mismatch endonuclease (patch repair protein)
MAKTPHGNTTPELELRRELHARGLRFRIDRPVLPDKRRRADIVFGPSRVAIFVDGCFWHGCPEHATWPSTNEQFWREKIETNRQRDRDTNAQLEAGKWQVIRVWEHEDPVKAANQIEQAVRRRRSSAMRPGTASR